MSLVAETLHHTENSVPTLQKKHCYQNAVLAIMQPSFPAAEVCLLVQQVRLEQGTCEEPKDCEVNHPHLVQSTKA